MVTPLTLKECGPLTANMISLLVGQQIGDDGRIDYSNEDSDCSDESNQGSPTPAATKGKGPLFKGEKVLLEAGRM